MLIFPELFKSYKIDQDLAIVEINCIINFRSIMYNRDYVSKVGTVIRCIRTIIK